MSGKDIWLIGVTAFFFIAVAASFADLYGRVNELEARAIFWDSAAVRIQDHEQN